MVFDKIIQILQGEAFMRKTVYGGQALLEGLMIKGPEGAAIAIRKPDNEIIVEKKIFDISPRAKKAVKMPIIRGIVEFFRLNVHGIKAMMYSAEFVELEEEQNTEPSKVDKFLDKLLGNTKNGLIYFTVVISILFSVALFMLLPNWIANFLPFNKNTSSGVFLYNLFEGIIKIIVFFGYLKFTSSLKDIKRVWMYHGAEHKAVNCYEHEEELTVENVKKYSIKHPRCGTSFLFIVIILSILLFSFLGWHNILINTLLRLLMVPLVAGLSYEVFRFVGRSNNKYVGLLNKPGLLVQYFTTKEPDDGQIEVAIAAFNGVLSVSDKDVDIW